MRKSLIILFLFFSGLCAAQRHNTIYGIFTPNDLGYGLRYDYTFLDEGIYVSVSHGAYTFPEGKIRSHTKVSIGVTQLSNPIILSDDYVFLSGGLVYNDYRGVTHTPKFDTNILTRVSMEIGAGWVYRWFSIAFTFDFVKIDSGIYFGVKF